MRAYDFGRKFGREFVVKVSARLIFGEKFGVFEFTNVMIVGARPCEKGVFAYRRGATSSVESATE